jgi:hypothetical protein
MLATVVIARRSATATTLASIRAEVPLRESGVARPVRFGEVGQVEISSGDRDK